MTKVTFNGVEHDARHGGAFDRGSADSYYGRLAEPHYYHGDTGKSTRIEKSHMISSEIDEYNAGYEWNEMYGSTKDYGE